MKDKIFFNCRQFTDSAAGKDASGNVTNITDKLLRSISDIKKTTMSMQNQWKLLSQLKDYLNKTSHDKNQHINFSKDWLDTLQKLTYLQFETIRKSSSEAIKTSDVSKNVDTKENDSKNLRITSISDQTESLVNNSTIIQPKIQQVIYKY